MAAERYTRIRNATVKLCEKLRPEDHVVQLVVYASPPKWHLGHTTWFFETFVLKPFARGYREFDPEYNFLFNSYYESIGERVQRDSRGSLFRPATEAIYKYRDYVDEAMLRFIPEMSNDAATVLELGLQHEQQHQELLVTDTKFLFGNHPLQPVWDEEATLGHYRQPETFSWLRVPDGVYTVGFQDEGFCFDNELAPHRQYIHSFEIMDRPVTNREYLEFINDGGYADFRYWLAEGWDWLPAQNISHPMYWNRKGDQWYFFHLNGLQELDPDLPVMHISYYEAEAYAHWKGLKLPTEFEWETAARLHPGAFAPVVWEWTQSAYLPYPGFDAPGGAIGEYNGKFMVNQMVLRGGSVATPEGHTRVSYRNFFHPHFQWQFSGLRLVRRGSLLT